MTYRERKRKEYINTIEKSIKSRCYRKAMSMLEGTYIKGFLVCKTTLKKKYRLSEKEISKLKYLEVSNPHYGVAPNMKLYLEQEVLDKLVKPKQDNNEG